MVMMGRDRGSGYRGEDRGGVQWWWWLVGIEDDEAAADNGLYITAPMCVHIRKLQHH